LNFRLIKHEKLNNYYRMTFDEIMIIAGLGAVGALWAFSMAGMLHVVWETTLKPLSDWLKTLKRR
jgi:hypothetical protein